MEGRARTRIAADSPQVAVATEEEEDEEREEKEQKKSEYQSPKRSVLEAGIGAVLVISVLHVLRG